MTLVQYRRPADDATPARGAFSWVELMAPAVELAKAIATTQFVPAAMRNNPAAISAAILYGAEVGVGPMQSLAKIAVIDGRPTLAAETQRALVFAAGHELWLDESTATRCTWCGRRVGSDQITRVTWTMDDARRAGLAGKQNYRQYPRQMLSARASAELVRAEFADVVGGLAATEEIDDAEPGETATPLAGLTPTTKRRRRRAAVTVPTAPADAALTPAPSSAPLPPLPGDEVEAAAAEAPLEVHTPTEAEGDRLTDAQRRRMMANFRRRGMTDRGDRLRYTSALIGRQVTTSTELTTAEADRILDDLEAMREGDEVAADGALAEPLPLEGEA